MSERLDQKKNSFSGVCTGIILALALLFMAYLLPMSLLRTTGMSTGTGRGEIVSFHYDNFFFNVIVLAICISAVYLIRYLLEHVSVAKVTAALLLWTLGFGLAFVCSAKLQPTEDSYVVSFFARQAAKGDYSYYHEYFTFFPFQFGFVLYEELVFRAFALVLPNAPEGYASLALQSLNVVYTALGYYALIRAVGCLTQNEDVQKITAVLLAFFLPALLMTTYMYGNVPGFAFACLSVWMFLRFQTHRRIADGVLCALLMAIAVCLKLNCLIFFAAVVIVWLLRLFRKPELKSLLLLAFTVCLVLTLKGAPQKLYEARCGVRFGGGIPQLSWMAMGLSEGKSCSGWYDTACTTDAYRQAGYDREKAGAQAKETVAARLDGFASQPREALHFFSRKFLSQWNEPTCQGLWNNNVRKNYSEPGKLYELTCQRFARRLTQLMNYHQQLIFLGFTLGLILLLRRRDALSALFPLIVLGGQLYHLLFEAKSQYALSYIILMVPVAAYGFIQLSDYIEKKSERNGTE